MKNIAYSLAFEWKVLYMSVKPSWSMVWFGSPCSANLMLQCNPKSVLDVEPGGKCLGHGGKFLINALATSVDNQKVFTPLIKMRAGSLKEPGFFTSHFL